MAHKFTEHSSIPNGRGVSVYPRYAGFRNTECYPMTGAHVLFKPFMATFKYIFFCLCVVPCAGDILHAIGFWKRIILIEEDAVKLYDLLRRCTARIEMNIEHIEQTNTAGLLFFRYTFNEILQPRIFFAALSNVSR